MSLETPDKIRTLQRKLYRKAKEEPDYRFYLLYDKIYREDILYYAYELVKFNRGAAGMDGQTFAGIESQGLGKWLAEIREELRTKRYKPQPVRRVMIPKPGGGERPLGIPTIRDRVVQHSRNPPGWGGEPAAGQPVHEPVSEVLADHRTGEGFPGTGGQLRG